MRTEEEIKSRIRVFKDLADYCKECMAKLKPDSPEWSREFDLYYMFKGKVEQLEWVMGQ